MKRRLLGSPDPSPLPPAGVAVSEVVMSAHVAARHPADQVEPTHDAVLVALTDAELLMAWRSSCTRLARSRHLPNRTLVLVALAIERSWYLDELERRQIAGTWVGEQP